MAEEKVNARKEILKITKKLMTFKKQCKSDVYAGEKLAKEISKDCKDLVSKLDKKDKNIKTIDKIKQTIDLYLMNIDAMRKIIKNG